MTWFYRMDEDLRDTVILERIALENTDYEPLEEYTVLRRVEAVQTRKHDSAMPYDHEQEDGSFISEPGMSKREYFAITALQGLLSNPEYMVNPYSGIQAVEIADQLIKALNVTEHEKTKTD